jgi:hypothetical protein
MGPLLMHVITRETDLSEEEAFNLTKALVVPILNAFIQRLGQDHPLALELLQSLASLTPPN